MSNSKVQIVATIGPASSELEMLSRMVEHGLDVVRFNFSWPDFDERRRQVAHIRELEEKYQKRIPIIMDVPGPRVQEGQGHTYNHENPDVLTDYDKQCILFGIEQGIDYVAISFVGSALDVKKCREYIATSGGTQKIIAKIERKVAVDLLQEILEVSDAIMIARGDLGNEIPLEQIPFVEKEIIRACNDAGKPVITATQMMISMTENPTPTRAEVTDVAYAVLEGSDAVMLSEETAKGINPDEAVAMMERVIVESEKHLARLSNVHSL
jgi:pyruvate kinase